MLAVMFVLAVGMMGLTRKSTVQLVSAVGTLSATSTAMVPNGLAVDAAGNLYISDIGSHVVYKVTPQGGLSIVAGVSGSSGALTRGPATASEIGTPAGLAVDASSNVYFADSYNQAIGKVTYSGSTLPGILSIYAGNPGSYGAPIPGPATSTPLSSPEGIALDSAGNLYVADSFHSVVEKFTPSGTMSIVAGQADTIGAPNCTLSTTTLYAITCTPIPATSAYLDIPEAVAVDGSGDIFIADTGNHVVEEINSQTGLLSVIAGVPGSSGAPTLGPANKSALGDPTGLALEASGNLYIADPSNNVVEEINSQTGVLSVVAGMVGQSGPPTPGQATSSKLNSPGELAISGNKLYISDTKNNVVEKVDLAAGTLSIFAGTGTAPTPTPTSIPIPTPTPTPTSIPIPTPTSIPAPTQGSGYQLAAADGGVFSFDAPFYGSAANTRLNARIVGMARTPNGGGYWLVAADGGVFSFGDAAFHGSATNIRLNQPVVGMAVDPATGGYWLVAADGGVFSFDAPYYGSKGGGNLTSAIVGIASTPDGGGYWITTADGHVYGFGDASYHGDMAGKSLNQPIVGIASTPTGGGYWLVAADGGVFSFGDAAFHGSATNIRLNQPVVGMAVDPATGGYWLVAADGGVFSFDAPFYGSAANIRLNEPIVG
ncbi:unnamed protein product [Acidithrix sp. C25]|nr:unnamed protein product [Acidithrix sp. C25]